MLLCRRGLISGGLFFVITRRLKFYAFLVSLQYKKHNTKKLNCHQMGRNNIVEQEFIQKITSIIEAGFHKE